MARLSLSTSTSCRLDPRLFQKDSENFEFRTWGQSPPGDLAEEYKARFREAIARADIVGIHQRIE